MAANSPPGLIARPFLPASDFALSKAFYEAIGFEKRVDGDVAIFACGSGGFILQNGCPEGLAQHLMMSLMVEDLDAWWTHIQGLDLPGRFGAPAPRPPAMQPWGLRVAYVIDPTGILWHIAEARPGLIQDWP